MPNATLTTGIPELDRLLGGIMAGDNIVWELDSGAPVSRIVASYLAACEAAAAPVVYVSFNRSAQTIASTAAGLMLPGRFMLIDCFAHGKGNSDAVFLEFYRPEAGNHRCRAEKLENPADPGKLQEVLVRLGGGEFAHARYLFDSLTGMLDLWGDEEAVLRFFGHICPRLFDLDTVAYWLLEKEAHSEKFLAKVRHITQVVLEVAVPGGVRTLTIRRSANRRSSEIGVPRRFYIEDDRLVMAAESREDRELSLLTRMGEALGSAREPGAFFERTMGVLANELGIIRGTLVLRDRATERLRIVAAHGLSAQERARGEYALGEGIVGSVVATGRAEVVRDIRADPRFLDRTEARRAEAGHPIAFICVPLTIDDEIVGALSADRPFAVEATLEKDLRLLSIVASTVSQVLRIHRLIRIEKEELLVRDERLLRELRSKYRLDNVVGQSRAIQQVLATAATAAQSRATVLITGETGTGKELIANIVHYNSDRAAGPFVRANCGALPEPLLESELFGHVRGAFTGAVRDRKGRFALADGGTLFLDEASEMSPRLQVKLLRVLQEMEFEPVGGTGTVRVDVRVVASTNKDLREEIRHGRFREDLYYRLNVIPIHLPPLRERRADIPLLVDHFLDVYNRRNKRHVTKLSREVLDLLLKYPWPGNVRELENCIERTVVMSPGETLSVDLLPDEVTAPRRGRAREPAEAARGEAAVRRAAEEACAAADDLGPALSQLVRTVEEAVLRRGLALGLSQRELAERLGLSRMTLRKKLREYDVR